MEKIAIRTMQAEDLSRVLEVERQSFRNPWSVNLFLGELRRGKIARNFVAVAADHRPTMPRSGRSRPRSGVWSGVCGFIMAWQVADEIHINNIAVAPEARQKGVATQLIAHLLTVGREQGAVRCTLEVRVSNRRARSLYSGLGFKKAGIRKRYYSDGEDALMLELDLVEGKETDSGVQLP